MSTKSSPDLTDRDVRVLHRFAWEHGRTWKQSLRDEWMRACGRLPLMLEGEEYRSVLQRLRNRPDFGCRGLEKFRLPAGFCFKGK